MPDKIYAQLYLSMSFSVCIFSKTFSKAPKYFKFTYSSTIISISPSLSYGQLQYKCSKEFVVCTKSADDVRKGDGGKDKVGSLNIFLFLLLWSVLNEFYS